MVKVTWNGVTKEFQEGILLEELAKAYQENYKDTIALAVVDGKIRELNKTLDKDCNLSFFTVKDSPGQKTYLRTATMALMKAISLVVSKEAVQKCKVEFTIGHGYYVSVGGVFEPNEDKVADIKKTMQDIIDQNLMIHKKSYPITEAMELFAREGMRDKEKLFRYRRSSSVNIYEIDGYFDYYYGYMFPSLGYIKAFDLIPYDEGMMLVLPKVSDMTVVPDFEPRKNLFNTMKNATKWGKQIGIETVGDLNDQICKGSISEMILVQEAEQERKIGEIAKDIVARGGVKFVMIAGPSSSGKTTFSHRLSVQLRTQGLVPHPIALDDYFVDREKTPRDENGDYNFECLEALDVELFNSDMSALLEGKEVELPTFNFKTGKREYKGNIKKLGPEDILVIEGIHGLNDKMSYSLPSESKYKVYISALTSVNVDEHNRIPTTDGRLLRRMVRDARTRGASAQRTIQMWPSVRRGEEENIFPFQESADAMFNSALIYELAVLKQFAEPLLFGIEPSEPEYYEAKRLLKFLDYFLGVSSENIPNNSICREFVGGSCFNV